MSGAADDKKENFSGPGQANWGTGSGDGPPRGLADLTRMITGEHDQGEAPARPLPPVHLWDPPSCGDIGLEVLRDGTWRHQGAPIPRPALVRLFASLLKRDDTGRYWVVTPVEKAPVAVVAAPLLAVALVVDAPGAPEQALRFVTNMGDGFTAGADNPVRMDHAVFHDGPAPLVTVRHGPACGIEALLTRSCYFDLAQFVEEDPSGAAIVRSQGIAFVLSPGPGSRAPAACAVGEGT